MIRLSKASVGAEELAEVATVLTKTVNFGLGIHVDQFEQDIKAFIASPDTEVIAVNTGTHALHIALEALEFPRGSEVIIPSITFLASFSATSQAGLVPVACEVNRDGCHLDCEDMERRITPKTVAIMPVAYAGVDFDRERVYDIAERHHLRVIEDDAHAFGSTTRTGQIFGATGDVICFSFDGIKNITCGEGGAVLTKDKNLARAIRIRRSLGIEKDVELRYQGSRAWEYNVEKQGFRYHMSNINAAIGVAQLRKFKNVKQRKFKLAQTYQQYLETVNAVDLRQHIQAIPNISETDCLHIFSCLLAPGTDRPALRQFLKDKGIETGIHYVPNHVHKMYRTDYPLPVAEDIGRRLISLPYHPDVTVEDIAYIAEQLRAFFKEART